MKCDLHSPGGTACLDLHKAIQPMFDEFGFPRSADLDDAAPTLYTFVYCSRAAEGVDDAAVGPIVESGSAPQSRPGHHGRTGL